MFARSLISLALLFSSSAMAYQPGDWVLAQWKGDEYWFPGLVERVEGNRVTVAYDDGTRETRPVNQVRPYNWDVGSRVECRWAGGSEWHAGRITAVSSDGEGIRVDYDDGDREETRTGFCRSR